MSYKVEIVEKKKDSILQLEASQLSIKNYCRSFVKKIQA